jgi:uncharacterized low-complexity protein
MKRTQQTALTLALGTAIAATLAAAPVTAAENPFVSQAMSQGYMVASADSKAKEGKCGEGKCGGAKAKAKEGKCGEGKCGGKK